MVSRDGRDLVEPHVPAASDSAISSARQLGGRAHRGDGAHRLLAAADVGAAARASCCTWRSWREMSAAVDAERLQPRRVELDPDLARDAADAVDRADAGHGSSFSRDVVVDEPGQRLVVHARSKRSVKASTGWPRQVRAW